jgi:predicted dienelactone hydrolase
VARCFELNSRPVFFALCAGILLAIAGAMMRMLPAAQHLSTHSMTASSRQAQDGFQGVHSDPVSIPYAQNAPRYQVGSVDDVVLRDSTRNKDLHFKILYPESQGSFPVIIFSHGYGGSKDAYSFLTRYWAEHGYVTLQPNHADAHELRRFWLGGRRLRKGMEKTLNDPAAWDDRVRDLTFLMDTLSDLERRTPQLAGKLDTQCVGVGGHSFGAFTTMLVAGVTVDVPNGPRDKSYADPRPRAFLALSPQGRGSRGLTAHAWEGAARPLMVMTGSRDRGAEGEGPAWRQDPFRLSPPGNKYLVFVDGASHLTFAGLPIPLGESRKMIAAIQTASLAFWDAYLKHSAQGKAWLASGALHQVCPAAKLDQR